MADPKKMATWASGVRRRQENDLWWTGLWATPKMGVRQWAVGAKDNQRGHQAALDACIPPLGEYSLLSTPFSEMGTRWMRTGLHPDWSTTRGKVDSSSAQRIPAITTSWG